MFKPSLAVPVVGLSLLFGACTTAPTQTTKVQKLSDDPIVQREMKRQEKQARKCFRGMASLSKEGRLKFVNCMAPTPARKKALKLCIQYQVEEQGIPLGKARQTRFANSVARCLVVTG